MTKPAWDVFAINSSYFLALAIVDSMVLMNVILLKGWPNMVETASFYVNIFPIAHPMMNLSWIMSIYLTVLLTVERYYALCWSRKTKSNAKKTKIVLGCILLFAIIYSIPKCMEYTVRSNQIRTDYDLQDRLWNNLFKENPTLPIDLQTNDHFTLLQTKPDNAESGTYDCESHDRLIKYTLHTDKTRFKKPHFLFWVIFDLGKFYIGNKSRKGSGSSKNLAETNSNNIRLSISASVLYIFYSIEVEIILESSFYCI